MNSAQKITRKGQVGQAGNPGQFAAKAHAEADDGVSFLEDSEGFAPVEGRGRPVPGPANPFVIPTDYTRAQWYAARQEVHSAGLEVEKAREALQELPLASSQAAEYRRRIKRAEERAARARYQCQEALVRHAASGDEGWDEAQAELAAGRANAEYGQEFGSNISPVAFENSAMGVRKGYEQLRGERVGRDCERITAAEARRRLPVGAEVTRRIAIGPRTGRETENMRVIKQTPHEQTLEHRPADGGLPAHSKLGWGGSRAYTDDGGRIIVCNENDVPLVIYERTDVPADQNARKDG